MRIDYHPAIAAELEEIRDHYESCSFGLGTDFIDEFERQVFAIAAMPTRWMVLRGDLRRSLMKRFPYVILLRTHRVATGVGFHQLFKGDGELWVLILEGFSATAGNALPAPA